MNAIAAPKSLLQNRLEGFALTAILEGFPSFVAAALLLKLVRHDITGGFLQFVVVTSVMHGLFVPWLAPKFSKVFKRGYEPLFFNASLSFPEKIAKWRERPATSVQLVTTELMLALLALAVVCVR
jgi:hypothetical protein